MSSGKRGKKVLSGERGKEREERAREIHCCCPLLAATLPYSTPSG